MAPRALQPLTLCLQPAEPALLRRDRWFSQMVHALVMLPDGDTAVVSSEDGSLRVVSLGGGGFLRGLHGHAGPVNDLVLTPDSRRLVTAGDDHTVRVWDTATWACLHVLTGHTAYIRQVAATDHIALSGCQDHTARVWDLRTGACLHVLSDHREQVGAVALSSDGRLGATVARDNALYLWDLEKGALRHRLYDAQAWVGDMSAHGFSGLYLGGRNSTGVGHEQVPHVLHFTPDGRFLLSAGEELIVWDLAEGREHGRYARQAWPLHSLLPLPGGTLALGGRGIHVWQVLGPDGETWLPPEHSRRLYTLATGSETVESMALSPDGSLLCAGHHDGEITQFCVPGPEAKDDPWLRRQRHPDNVNEIVVAPAGGHAASRGSDGSVWLWRVGDRPEPRVMILSALAANGRPFAFSSDGRSLLVCGKRWIEVWDVAGARCLRRVEGPLGTDWDEIHDVAPLPPRLDEERALVGVLGHGLYQWDLQTGTGHAFEGYTSQVSHTRITGDGLFAVSTGYFAPGEGEMSEEERRDAWRDNCSQLQGWDVVLRRLCWTRAGSQHFGSPFLLDERRVLTRAPEHEGSLMIWDVRTGAPLREIEIGGTWADGFTRLPDGALLLRVTDSEGSWAQRLDLDGGSGSRVALPGGAAAFLPDGSGAVVQNEGGLLLVDLGLGEVCGSFSPFGAEAGSAGRLTFALMPDGRHVIAGDAYGQVHVLQLCP